MSAASDSGCVRVQQAIKSLIKISCHPIVKQITMQDVGSIQFNLSQSVNSCICMTFITIFMFAVCGEEKK